MRIGLLTTCYPRSDSDVAGDFVRGYARTLASLGHTVDVLTPEPRYACAPLDDASITVTQVPYIRPRHLACTFYGAGVPDNVRLDPRAWPGLLTYPAALAAAATVRGKTWDAWVSHWALPCALVAGALCRDAPHVAVMHSADVHLLERLPGASAFATAIERNATHLVFVSDDLAGRFARVLGREPATPWHVEPMGFEPSAPAPSITREELRAQLGLKGFVVMTMGRLVPIKGIDRVIRALVGFPGATLIVAGDGPERGALQELARALGVDTRFVGVIRAEAKAAWMAASDVFVLASRTMPSGRTEGSPVSIMEAMHAGLAVVAMDSGGAAELVGDAGFIVPDEVALRVTLQLIGADASLRAEAAARARERASKHTWSERAATIERIFVAG